ncbi:MAG: MBL fold metallo-hydrolase [Chloroflexota bacterium]
MAIAIRWVNHASFVFECGDVRLLTDPWLFGSAFHNGWDLLCKTHFDVSEFADISHIWFSHEHPDHFSPPVLKEIPEEIRSGITVIFQETDDKKVVSYCMALGFTVQELANHGWYELTPECRVMCGKVPFFDSWLLLEAIHSSEEMIRILNANDCVVDGEAIASDIFNYTGTVDLLLTQFSYAIWEGNPDEVERRRASAAEKLERVRLQIETFQPAYTIPFASFIYFSHEENFYCNDSINTVRDAHSFIRQETASQPVVLYPEERWVVGSIHESEASLQKYDQDYDLGKKPLRKSEPVAVDQLALHAQDYIERMTDKNSPLLIRIMSMPVFGYFQTLKFYLTDLRKTVEFDMRDGLQMKSKSDDESKSEMSESHIMLSSESLAYIFQNDWGFDTLTVNGRFQASQANYKRMMKALFLGPLNNTGRYLRPKTFFEPAFILRALSKLRKLG